MTEKIFAAYDKKVGEVLENLVDESGKNFAEHFPDADQHFIPVNPEVFKFMLALYTSQMPTKEEWIDSLMESCRKKYGRNFVMRVVEENGDIMIRFAKQDNGTEQMTLAEAAVYLNLTRAQLKTRCQSRFRDTQLKNGQTPLADLIHGIGRDKYFLRSELMAYKQGPAVAVVSAEAARDVANLKGKKPKEK